MILIAHGGASMQLSTVAAGGSHSMALVEGKAAQCMGPITPCVWWAAPPPEGMYKSLQQTFRMRHAASAPLAHVQNACLRGAWHRGRVESRYARSGG